MTVEVVLTTVEVVLREPTETKWPFPAVIPTESVTVTPTLKEPAEENLCVIGLPAGYSLVSAKYQRKLYGAVPPEAEAVKVAESPTKIAVGA